MSRKKKRKQSARLARAIAKAVVQEQARQVVKALEERAQLESQAHRAHIRTTVRIANWPEATADWLIERGVTPRGAALLFRDAPEWKQ